MAQRQRCHSRFCLDAFVVIEVNIPVDQFVCFGASLACGGRCTLFSEWRRNFLPWHCHKDFLSLTWTALCRKIVLLCLRCVLKALVAVELQSAATFFSSLPDESCPEQDSQSADLSSTILLSYRSRIMDRYKMPSFVGCKNVRFLVWPDCPELSVQQIFVFVYLLTKIYPLAASEPQTINISEAQSSDLFEYFCLLTTSIHVDSHSLICPALTFLDFLCHNSIAILSQTLFKGSNFVLQILGILDGE